MMFAKDMYMERAKKHGISLDDYIDKIDFPDTLDLEIQKLSKKEPVSKKIAHYKGIVSKTIEETREFSSGKYGLSVQFLTVFEKGDVFFRMYYAGKGMFWETSTEDMQSYDWGSAYTEADGTIIIPDNCSDIGIKISENIDRDFRQYTVMENIVYCLTRITCLDEWQDCIEIRKDGVSIEVSKIFLMKMLNEENFPDIYYIEGIMGDKSLSNGSRITGTDCQGS